MSRYLEAVCRTGQDVNPLFAFLGVQLCVAEKGEAELRLPLSPKLAQGVGLVAGGILATLADEAMAHAVLSRLDEESRVVTAEMNIRFLRPTDPKKPGELVARGKVVKLGRHLITAEAAITGADGRLAATAGGTFWLLEPEK